MEARTYEIRDRMTFVPALAVKLNPGCEADRFLIAKAGFGRHPDDQASFIILMKLADTSRVECDPYAWGDRTMSAAHKHIAEHWPPTGSVVDVRHVLGETPTPCESENPS